MTHRIFTCIITVSVCLTMVSSISYDDVNNGLNKKCFPMGLSLEQILNSKSLVLEGKNPTNLGQPDTYIFDSGWVVQKREIATEGEIVNIRINEPYFATNEAYANNFVPELAASLKQKSFRCIIIPGDDTQTVYIVSPLFFHQSLWDALVNLDNYQNRILWRMDAMADLMVAVNRTQDFDQTITYYSPHSIAFKYKITSYEDANHLPFSPMINLYHNLSMRSQQDEDELKALYYTSIKIMMLFLNEGIWLHIKDLGWENFSDELMEEYFDCDTDEAMVKNDPYYCTYFVEILNQIYDNSNEFINLADVYKYLRRAVRTLDAEISKVYRPLDEKYKYHESQYSSFLQDHVNETYINEKKQTMDEIKSQMLAVPQDYKSLIEGKAQCAMNADSRSDYSDSYFKEFVQININKYNQALNRRRLVL